MKILVLNAGSSSQKSCLYELGKTLPTSASEPLWEAKIDWTKKPGVAVFQVKTHLGACLEEELVVDERQQAIAHMLNTLWSGSTQVISQLSDIDLVGHRVVHGGSQYTQATMVTPEVKAVIAQFAILAVAHNPANLEGIEAIEQILPQIPQMVVFDTAFHASLPMAAAVYPGPYEWLKQGIRRYGFHGISHQYCVQQAAQILSKPLGSLRLISCHLGNGCSLAAVQHGVCIDTTMGYTPLEGLMMGSRSGSIDPSIIIDLIRQGQDATKLNQILNQESGLKGLSGISSDLREVLKAKEAGNARAQLAFDVYIHRMRSHIGAMMASLGGLDAIIFTGGVGENSAQVRIAALENFQFLGINLDLEQNDNSPTDIDIATAESAVRVVVVHTQEDWAIATQCWKLALNQF